MSKQQDLITRQEQLPAQATIYDVFASMARDPSIEPARIAQLMELHERAERREAERQFISAMTRLQPRLPRITKDGKIDLGRGKPLTFAKYETLDEAIRPLYTEEGFSITFGTKPGRTEKELEITATLSHAGGHSRTESMPLPMDQGPGRNALQAVGSTISYGRRYLLGMLFNLITVGDDNDGQSQGFISEQQTNTILDMFAGCEMDQQSQSKFLELMQSESVSEIQKRDYPKAMSLLQAKLKKLRGAQ